jgi:hypothetical protein
MNSFYIEQMPGLNTAIKVIEILIQNLIPDIDCFLEDMKITVDYFASQWLLTLFSYDITDHATALTIIIMSVVYGKKLLYKLVL